MPAYQHKFKTGQTVVANGKGEGVSCPGDNAIIIATWKELARFSNSFMPQVHYNESSPETTYYSTYSIDRNYTWWYWEEDIELYCSNTERGKNNLKYILTGGLLSRTYGFSSLDSKKFISYIFDDDKVNSISKPL